MKNMVIMVGNIGTGKSTEIKRYKDAGFVVISRDGLRYSIGSGEYIFNEKYEPIIHKLECQMLEEFLKLGVDVVVDEVNVNKASRKRLINIGKKYDYKIYGHIKYPLKMREAVNRRMKDPHGQPDRRIWEAVWTNFNSMYEKPKLDEGFNRIFDEEKIEEYKQRDEFEVALNDFKDSLKDIFKIENILRKINKFLIG